MSFGKNFSPLRGEILLYKISLYRESKKNIKTCRRPKPGKRKRRAAAAPAAIVGRKAGQAAEERYRENKMNSEDRSRLIKLAGTLLTLDIPRLSQRNEEKLRHWAIMLKEIVDRDTVPESKTPANNGK